MDHPSAAAFLAALFGLLAGVLSVFAFNSYGLGLFLLVPVAEGMLAALLYSWNRPRTRQECAEVALLAGVMTFAGFGSSGRTGSSSRSTAGCWSTCGTFRRRRRRGEEGGE
ncbi:MAG TPA: hypothetical protein VHN15_00515, partial [Thermoanaerobaculia bacterium]|nr:hypothetical protein [Thermoanaerobaculia bacterium]